MKFNFIFATGRTGTAFLSQAFGFNNWGKKDIHFVDNKSIVSHECWTDIPIKQLKKVGINNEEAFDIIGDFLNNKINDLKKRYKGVTNIFITDNKIGRYLGYYIISNFDYKVVHIERDVESLVNSYIIKIRNKEISGRKLSKLEFSQSVWISPLYNPSDKFIINKVSVDDWNNFKDYEKFAWFHKEVKSQWNIFKRHLNKGDYLEIDFNDLIHEETIKKISKFLEMRYCKNLLKKKVNYNK